MSLATALVLTALVASIVLVLQSHPRLFSVIAVVAAGIETLFIFKIVTFRVKGFDMWLVLGAALLVAGIVCWIKNGVRSTVTAATLVAFVGAIQVFLSLT